ncbi:MAG: hypothetical protein JST93_33950 [Acidobacteria bacterium]|nr:hypothetical protein [Acidobacteriota bacterium]
MYHLFLLGALLAAQQTDWPKKLTSALPITQKDFDKINKGDSVGRVLRVPNSKSIGILAMIRLPVTSAHFWDWYRHPENFTQSDMVEASGEVHIPARPEDFNTLPLPPADPADLPSCKPGHCAIKATDAEIEAIQPHTSAEQQIRQWFHHTAQAFQQHGNEALPSATDYKELGQASQPILALFPHLHACIEQSPQDPYYFWTIERYGFGLKPVVNLMFASPYRPEPGILVICSKQLRASHYYDASLGITILLDRPDGTSTMIYINRSRIDALDEAWKRRVVERFAPRAIRKQLAIIKRTVTAWRNAAAIPQPTYHRASRKEG